jgi:hypothetical protein
MNRRSRAACATALLTLFGAGLRAHDVTPPPVAELAIAENGERLNLTAHLPIAALSDVKLPRGSDGRILREGLEQPLQIVARDLAASLEFEQAGAPLPMPTLRAALTPDDGFVDVELGYLIRAGAGNLSARLSTFRAAGNPVAIVARFADASGRTRTFTVPERSERVTFDPDTTTAITHFVGRGATTLLDNWDVLLFVICLVVPGRPVRSRRLALLLMLTGETIGAAFTAAGWPVLQAAVLPAIMAVAASAIVIVALQSIVSPESGWLAPLSLGFGLANGVAVGHTFGGALAYAGNHPIAAFVTFIVVVLLVQLWVIVLLSSATGLLYRWGLPERIAALVTSIAVCHTALDRLADRSTVLAEVSDIGADHFLITLTLAWLVMVLAAGLLSARGGGAAFPGLPSPARARP